MMKKTTSTSIKTLFIEIFSVVFAVLLALGVDSWNKKRKQYDQASLAMSKMRKEIQHNLEELDKQRALIDTTIINFSRYIKTLNGEEVKHDINLNYDLPNKTTAWEATKLTQTIQFIKFETIDSVSNLYSGIEFYNKMTEKIVDHFYQLNLLVKRQKRTLLNLFYLHSKI